MLVDDVGGGAQIAPHLLDLSSRKCDLAPQRVEPSMDRRQASLILIGRDDAALVSRQSGERQRLAAAARAQIDRGLARLHSGKERDELRGLVLDLDEAVEEGGLGLHGRAASILPVRKAQPER